MKSVVIVGAMCSTIGLAAEVFPLAATGAAMLIVSGLKIVLE